MLYIPFIAVFIVRHMDLAVISEYAVLLKVFVFQLTFTIKTPPEYWIYPHPLLSPLSDQQIFY